MDRQKLNRATRSGHTTILKWPIRAVLPERMMNQQSGSSVTTIRTLLLLFCITIFVLQVNVLHAENSNSVRELRFEPVDKDRSRTVPLKVYISDDRKPRPVILFSHGLGGSRENNGYLGKHWAAAGYVAVFMQHARSDNEVWKTARPGQRLTALKAATGATSLRNRLADVPFVINQLDKWNKEEGHTLHDRLNLKRIGMSGHSYGAVTTLGVAGRKYPFNRSFPDERIDAFLPMSPQPGKGLDPKKAFGHLAKPILCMTGTKDGSPLDPTLKPSTRREVFAALPVGDKYQLVLKNAEHSAFGDSLGRRSRGRNSKHHPAIQKISLHFWDAYLKDDTESKAWLQSTKPVTESGLNEISDIWEWK